MEMTKPAWLRRVHVAAHMGHAAQGCPLCARIMAEHQDIIDNVQAVAARLRNIDQECTERRNRATESD